MGFFNRLANTSEFAQEAQDRALRQAQIIKFLAEAKKEEDAAKTSNPKTSAGDYIFQTGDPGRLIAEQKARAIFGTPIGPLPEAQQGALATIRGSVPDLQTKTGIPNEFSNQPLSVIEKAAEVMSKFKGMNAKETPTFEPVMDQIDIDQLNQKHF